VNGRPDRRLIINADDLGYDPAINRGIVEAMRSGAVTSATLMVNLPHSSDGAAQARGLAVGLHLNLARGTPVSSRFPVAFLVSGAFDESRVAALAAEVVEDEALAQLDRAAELLGRPATHADVHRHLHRHPPVLEGLSRAAARRGIPVRALDATMRTQLRARGIRTTDHFLGEAGAEPYWTAARFSEALAALEPGTTEWMCHPGHLPSQVKSGYAVQRVVELETLGRPGARAELERAGVQLVNFAAV
jgi:chitin disaccharide deacetylase